MINRVMIFLILVAGTLIAMEQNVPYVTLVSEYGDKFKVPKAIAMHASQIKALLEAPIATNEQISQRIEFNHITGPVLESIVQIMVLLQQNNSLKGSELIKAAAKEANSMDLMLIPVIKALDFLGFDLGMEVAVQRIIDSPHLKTAAQNMIEEEAKDDPLNDTEKVIGYSASIRNQAIGILKIIIQSYPEVLNIDTFIYYFLNALNDVVPFIYPYENDFLKTYINSLKSCGAQQWLKDYLFLRAADWEDQTVLEKLLDDGANINAHIGGRLPLLAVLHGQDLSRLLFLIQKGANVNGTDDFGRTPLMIAILNYNPEAVKMLLNHGANPNAQDLKGLTPLFYISSAMRGIIKYKVAAAPAQIEKIKEIITLLINSGADLKARSREGKSLMEAMIDRWNYYKDDFPESKYPHEAQIINLVFPQIIEFLKIKGVN